MNRDTVPIDGGAAMRGPAPSAADGEEIVRDGSVIRPVTVGATVAFLWAVTIFFPSPSVPVGRTAALQMGDIAGLVSGAIVLVSGRIPRRHLLAWFILFCPVVASLVSASGDKFQTPELLIKGLITWMVYTLQIVVTGYLCAVHRRKVLAGVSVAIIVHGAMGLYQVYGFSRDEFPLLWVFGSVFTEQQAMIYALWIKRPFGFFQEPSAMAAAIGPWLALFCADAFGILQSMAQFPRGLRLMMRVALVAGTILMGLSLTRYGVFLAAGFVALGSLWMLRGARSSSAVFVRVTLAVLLIVTLGLALQHAFTLRFSGRDADREGVSDPRALSILDGLAALAEGDNPARILLGVGVGESASMMQRTKGWDAVWSVLLTYVLETGILGAAACLVIGFMVVRQLRRSTDWLAGAVFFFLWLMGVGLTTSFYHLIPIWCALGWLLSWGEGDRLTPMLGGLASRPPAPGSREDDQTVNDGGQVE